MIVFDGMRFRRRYDLEWRYAKAYDKYVDGRVIPSNYAVFFRKKTGKDIPLTGHGLTNKAYGEERGTGSKRSTPIFLSLDGKVYSTTFRRTPR